MRYLDQNKVVGGIDKNFPQMACRGPSRDLKPGVVCEHKARFTRFCSIFRKG